MIVVSFGIIPQPTTFTCTLHSALTMPAVGVTGKLGVAAAAVPTAGSPGGTATVPVGTTSKQVGAGGIWQVVPKKPTLPRFGSVCLVFIAAASAAPFPSQRRSKSGVANVGLPAPVVLGPTPVSNSSNTSGSVPSPIRQGRNVSVSAVIAAPPRSMPQRAGGLSGF